MNKKLLGFCLVILLAIACIAMGYIGITRFAYRQINYYLGIFGIIVGIFAIISAFVALIREKRTS